MNPIIDVVIFILLWRVLAWWISELHWAYIKWQVERNIKKTKEEQMRQYEEKNQH